MNNIAVLKINEKITKVHVYDGIDTYEFDMNDDYLLYQIIALRYKVIYIWEANALFAYIDSFAKKKKLLNYAEITINVKNQRQRCNEEAISYKDGPGMYYQRKLWLKTKKYNSTDRHTRLSATIFINFSNYFGGQNFKKVCKSFAINQALLPHIQLWWLLKSFDSFILKLSNLQFIKSNGAPLSWTIGGLAKLYYLKLYAPNSNNPRKEYIERNPQSKPIEYILRNANLLLPGLLYLKDKRKHKNCIKFDKNSLFPAAEIDCPFFGIPIKSSWKEYINDNKKNHTYIFIFSGLTLKRKPNSLSIFKPPATHYTGINEDVIFLDNQAFFDFYYDILCKFYDIIDFEKLEVYRLNNNRDYAIKKYVNNLYTYKVAAKEGKISKGLYTLVKYFLNNLHGKFAQLTLNEDYDYIINSDGIIERRIVKVNDNWENSHFDYIRGAWIYAKSQAIMLNDLLKLSEAGIDTIKNIYYIDTDCLIINIDPNEFKNILPCSEVDLGAYKLEQTYTQFKVYAPKTYCGLTESNIYKFTCAGLNSEEILDYINNKYPDKNIIDILSRKNAKYPTTVTRRTPTGASRVTLFRPIGGGFGACEEGGILYETDNNS